MPNDEVDYEPDLDRLHAKVAELWSCLLYATRVGVGLVAWLVTLVAAWLVVCQPPHASQL